MRSTQTNGGKFKKLDKIKGSIAAASILQLTDAKAEYDAESKELLSKKEFLAIILKHTIKEYENMEYQDIADLIDGISRTTEISPGRTNQNLTSGVNPEFNVINEKLSRFDVLFKVKDPKTMKEEATCFIHFNIEPQKDFRPGYPLEKRGIYHMARMISSQSDVVDEKTDYGSLEKVYTIWISQDRIPKALQNTVTLYGMTNLWSSDIIPINKDDHDLMSMVIVRLGNPNVDSKEHIVRFLNALLHTRDEKSYKVINEYVDFSDSLKQEVGKVMGASELVEKYGEAKGETKAILKMHKKGFSMTEIADIMEVDLQRVEEAINEVALV
ncbi:MAG: hypothetical protein FWC41_03420 [Firmicutes bacterium]|nr:hypothetical protein [Bacillota bacterium]